MEWFIRNEQGAAKSDVEIVKQYPRRRRYHTPRIPPYHVRHILAQHALHQRPRARVIEHAPPSQLQVRAVRVQVVLCVDW